MPYSFTSMLSGFKRLVSVTPLGAAAIVLLGPQLAVAGPGSEPKGVPIVPTAGALNPPDNSASPATGTTGSKDLTAELNIRVDDEQAEVTLDGQKVGKGSYRGMVTVGKRHLRVERPGFDTYDTWLQVNAGQVRTETVSLRQSVAAVEPLPGPTKEVNSNGIYGGVSLLGSIQPLGTGTPFEESCDTLGAYTCSAKPPLGAGLGLHIGWLKEPLGIELYGQVSAQTQVAHAKFDGVKGTEVNPVVAAPERDEKFLIGRFGAGLALRGRLAYSTSLIRLWLAVGPGIAYRSIVFRRDTQASDGGSSDFAQAFINYWSPMLSSEAGIEFRITKSFGISIGVNSWFENAGDGARSDASQDVLIVNPNGDIPAPQATPSYQLARGPQWYIGPSIGFHFGM